MFDKLKQMNQLRALQKELQRQKFTAERNGITITMNGGMTIEEVRLNYDLSPAAQQDDLKNCMNEVIKQAQKGMAEKMKGMDLNLG